MAARVLARHPAVHLAREQRGDTCPPARRRSRPRPRRAGRTRELPRRRLVMRAFLPGLELAARTGRSHIVNVVSIAGASHSPPPGLRCGQACATGFLPLAARALRGSGIEVHTVLPGFVQTEGFTQRALLEHPVLRHIVARPDRVAETIVKAVERGRSEVVVPWFPYRAAILMHGVAPVLVSRLGTRVVRRSRLPGEGRRSPGAVRSAPDRCGSPWSPGLRQGSARRRRGSGDAGWRCVLVARREDCSEAWRRRSEARSKAATSPTAKPSPARPRGSSSAIAQFTCSSTAPASSPAAPSSTPRRARRTGLRSTTWAASG